MSNWLNGSRRLGRPADIMEPPEARTEQYQFEEALELLDLQAKGAMNFSIVDATPINRTRKQWQQTRMTDPGRAERWCLALAVATPWLVRVGGAAETADAPASLPELHEPGAAARPRALRGRLAGIFRRSWVEIIVALLQQQRLPLGGRHPEAWPPWPDCPAPAPANAATTHAA